MFAKTYPSQTDAPPRRRRDSQMSIFIWITHDLCKTISLVHFATPKNYTNADVTHMIKFVMGGMGQYNRAKKKNGKQTAHTAASP